MRCRCRTSYKGRRLSVYMRQATGETSISWHITAGRRATTEENLNHKETRAYKNREVGDAHINCGFLIYGPGSKHHTANLDIPTCWNKNLFHDCPIPLLVRLIVDCCHPKVRMMQLNLYKWMVSMEPIGKTGGRDGRTRD